MRIAVHYGCHLLRPQPAVRWDDPLHPKKVEELVAALGARVVDYPTKMQCCGGALDRVGERDASLAFCRRKLHDLQNNEVDALVVVCPSCFQQFDLNQAALQRANENINVPILYLSELIDLAYGHEPEEIGLDMHRVSVAAVPRQVGGPLGRQGRARARTSTSRCSTSATAAGRARTTARSARSTRRFQPNDIIRELVEGNLDEVIAEGQLWKCLECYTCSGAVPLRHRHGRDVPQAQGDRDASRASAPSPSPQSYKMFLETGTLGKPKQGARKKLGLESAARQRWRRDGAHHGCDSDDSEGAE